MTNWKWEKKFPDQAGYYLATWRYGHASFRVSEFWFDGINWWTGRSYIRPEEESVTMDLGFCITEKIIAWTEKPKSFRGNNYDVETYTVH